MYISHNVNPGKNVIQVEQVQKNNLDLQARDTPYSFLCLGNNGKTGFVAYKQITFNTC